MINFTYEGEAVGKGRPRVSRAGGYVHTYTPAKTRQFEEEIRLAFKEQVKESTPVYPRDNTLCAFVGIGVSVPKSYSKKRREDCLNGREAPTKKPDIDNILKAIFDALNGYAYEDDAQIVSIQAHKSYKEEPSIYINIWEISEGRTCELD